MDDETTLFSGIYTPHFPYFSESTLEYLLDELSLDLVRKRSFINAIHYAKNQAHPDKITNGQIKIKFDGESLDIELMMTINELEPNVYSINGMALGCRAHYKYFNRYGEYCWNPIGTKSNTTIYLNGWKKHISDDLFLIDPHTMKSIMMSRLFKMLFYDSPTI